MIENFDLKHKNFHTNLACSQHQMNTRIQKETDRWGGGGVGGGGVEEGGAKEKDSRSRNENERRPLMMMMWGFMSSDVGLTY